MRCELIDFNEKRGELFALIDGEVDIALERVREVVILDSEQAGAQRAMSEAPALVDSRRLQSRVWQWRRSSYS